MEELLASSYMFGYLCLHLIFIFVLYLIGLILHIYLILLFVYFVFASIKLRFQ